MEDNNNVTNLNNIAGGVQSNNVQQPQNNFSTNYIQQTAQQAAQEVNTNAQNNNVQIPPYQQPQNHVQSTVQPLEPIMSANQAAQGITPGQPVNTGYTPVQAPIQQSQAPVQEPIAQANTVVQPTSQTVAQPQPNTQPEVTEPQAPATQVTPQPQEPVTSDNYIIKTENLKRLVNNAAVVATGDGGVMITSLIQILFTNEGLILKSTDQANTLTQIEKSIRYNNEMSIAVAALLLKDLVNKLDSEYVTLVPDAENNNITILADEDKFTIPESLDIASGETLRIEDIYNTSGSVNQVIDYSLFKEKLDNALLFSGSPNVSSVTGVYCSDKILGTDKYNFYATKNLPQLADNTFYLTRRYLSALTNLTFRNEVTISLSKDAQGEVTSINIHDSEMSLSGPTNPDIDEFPVQSITGFITAQQSHKCNIDLQKFSKALQISKMFIASASDDNGCVRLSTTQNQDYFTITDAKGASVQKVKLTPVDNSVVPTTLAKYINEDLLKALKAIDISQPVNITFDKDYMRFEINDGYIFITSQEM